VKKERMFEIINKFSDVSILVIGDIMLDKFIYGNVTRISPEAPVPVVEVIKEELTLGGSGNVINNIAKLNGNVVGVGVIGDDMEGMLIGDLYGEMNLARWGLIVDNSRKTSVKTRVIANNHHQIVRYDKETKKDLSEDMEDETIHRLTNIFENLEHPIDCVILSDYNKGFLTPRIIEKVKELCRYTRIPICVDPKKENFKDYEGTTIITPNLKEASKAYCNLPIEGDTMLKSAGFGLLKWHNFKAVLITQGEDGMTLFEKNGELTDTHYFPTEARDVYDVTGAGDTVISVLSLCLGAKASFREASIISNLAAGIVVGKVGTATVSKEELINLIKERYVE